MATAAGARTSLFVPDQSRLYLNQYIQAVCRKHHVRFVAETVRSLPDEPAKVFTAKVLPVAEGGQDRVLRFRPSSLCPS